MSGHNRPVVGGTHLAVADHIEQGNDIRPTRQVLQNLDLALDLLLLNGLEDFDHAFLVVDDVKALEDFRVFAAACWWRSAYSFLTCLLFVLQHATTHIRSFPHTDLAHDLVVLQHTPADVYAVVVPVCPRHLLIDIGVHARHDARFCEQYAPRPDVCMVLSPDGAGWLGGIRGEVPTATERRLTGGRARSPAVGRGRIICLVYEPGLGKP